MLRIRFSLVLFSLLPLVACVTDQDTSPSLIQSNAAGIEESQSQIKTITQPIASNGISYRYLFARIEPITNKHRMDKETESLWFRGAYFYLKPDGMLGLNWSRPGSYAYNPEYRWIMQNDKLTLILGNKSSYSFDISTYNYPMVANTDQGGKFKMTAFRKEKNEK